VSEVLFSSSWYRVAALRPRLRRHAQIHRHHYRGQLWYILQDHASQRAHRFSPAAYCLIGLMDGERSVETLWELASVRLGDDAPTQDEVIQLLTQLHAADVLQCDVPPDVTELLLRYERQRRQTWQSKLINPFFMQLPLFDPERFLQRWLPWVRPLFGMPGMLLWGLVVGLAVLLAAMHWHDLTENVMDRILVPHNLFLLWLVFPVVKTLHEFGHAFATKAYGGEVHEMGVMLLVLTPFPYMDASAASAFGAKWQRMVVGAAGMIVELFLAALALFVWLNVEPGVVRTVAYNVMFIAGISTVLFNGNPLLRYDGYYIFADYLEIPNLRLRAQAYLRYLWERYAFGHREAQAEMATRSERAWFVCYGLASMVYRLFVFVAVTTFVAGKFFFIGVVFAVLGVATGVLTPLGKLLTYLSTSPRLRRVRLRAGLVVGSVTALVVGVVCFAPVPLRSRAEGVIWVPERAHVRATSQGFVEQIVAPPGAQVRQGEVLLVCRDAVLETRVKVLEKRLQELYLRYTVQWLKEVSQAEIMKEEMRLLEENLARMRERVAELTIRSPADGTFVVPQVQDLPGQFLKQGTQVGYVLDLAALTVRVVVSQDDIDLVRQRLHGVEVRLAERRAQPLPAVIWRVVPAATHQLPSMALSSQGGGAIATDPRDTEGVKTVQRLFQLDLHLPSSTGIINIGGRVYVRFDHGREPLVQRWYRHVRRLFLSKFYV
jgi:putative peptide zinc metalloprotease protein